MCKDKKNHARSLRISSVVRGEKVNLTIDGKSIEAYKGETVHAALTAAGIKRLNHSKTHQARGIFCGMGICYECLVTINQIPDQRACMTLVEDQMEVQTDEG